jgi:hypothetical protein
LRLVFSDYWGLRLLPYSQISHLMISSAPHIYFQSANVS